MTWKRYGLRLLVVLSLLALGLVVAYLLENSRLEVAGSSAANGSVTVETALPQATCRKTLSWSFPYVRLNCDAPSSEAAP